MAVVNYFPFTFKNMLRVRDLRVSGHTPIASAGVPILPKTEQIDVSRWWQADVPDPGKVWYPPVRADPKPTPPFVPSTGFAGKTGGTIGVSTRTGRTEPPRITAESLAATIKSEWGGSFHPFD